MKIFKKKNIHIRFMKKIVLLMLLFSIGFSIDACKYNPKGFMFHCTNNMPGIELKPGEEGNITIFCCFTHRKYINSTEEVNITAKPVYEWVRKIQNPDGTWREEKTVYEASKFITWIKYPNSSRGFETFPVIIHYKLPANSPVYAPGKILQSRVDIMLKLGGGIIPNNAIFPRIRIPSTWVNANLVLAVVGIVIGTSLITSIALIRKRGKKKKIEKTIKENTNI